MVFCRYNNENKVIKSWYKVKISNSNIEVYVSDEGITWEILHICKKVWDTDMDRLIGGFYLNLFDNQYYKWICNNFIQLRYRKGERDRIGYPGLMNRDWRNYSIHPLVRFGYEKREIILKHGLWEYVIDSINSNRYLEIWLNEYYIEGLKAYKRYSFFHESLIYGYDEENGRIHMLSLYGGKIKDIAVSIDNLVSAWSEPKECCAVIRSLEYSPDENGYELDITHIGNELRNYLLGTNSTEDYMYIAQKEEGVFGLKIYDDILNTDIGNKEFLSDIRISYFIKEHKKCMKFRIDYLYEKDILSSAEYLRINSTIGNILKMAGIVLSLVLKNLIVPKVQLQNKIWDYLRNIKEQEQECYVYLLNVLKKNPISNINP